MKKILEFFFRGENKATELPSYQATELLSYRHEKNFQRKKSYQATELPSYWATGMKKKIPEIFLEEKIKLPSYQATEQKIWDSIHITCHYC